MHYRKITGLAIIFFSLGVLIGSYQSNKPEFIRDKSSDIKSVVESVVRYKYENHLHYEVRVITSNNEKLLFDLVSVEVIEEPELSNIILVKKGYRIVDRQKYSDAIIPLEFELRVPFEGVIRDAQNVVR